MDEIMFDENSHKALKEAIFAIKNYVEPYRDKDYIHRLKLMLLAVVSTTVEIAEAHDNGISGYLWSEIEKMAKEGGLTAVAEKIESDKSYSISNIEPQDAESGMNYLGQQLTASLYKHINDLPMQQRKPEMFLHGVEAMLANLLDQKFSGVDPHKVLDDFCGHVHMVLNNTQKSNGQTHNSQKAPDIAKQSKLEPVDFVVLAEKIDIKVKSLLALGGEETLLINMADLMDDVKPVFDAKLPDHEFDKLCNKYEGFLHFMNTLETIAGAIKDGRMKPEDLL